MYFVKLYTIAQQIHHDSLLILSTHNAGNILSSTVFLSVMTSKCLAPNQLLTAVAKTAKESTLATACFEEGRLQQ